MKIKIDGKTFKATMTSRENVRLPETCLSYNYSGYVSGDALRGVWAIADLVGYEFDEGNFRIDRYGSLWVSL